MANRPIESLLEDILNLGKQASTGNAAAEALKDPTEKGVQSGSVEEAKLIDPLPGQGASADVPAVTPTELAGDRKTEGGDVQVPAPNAFQTEGNVDTKTTKAATGILAMAADMREKLAKFRVAAPDTPAAPVEPSKEAGAPSAAPAGAEEMNLPGDILLKVAFTLMSTARGQATVLEALDEILGAEASAELCKKAADETSAFLKDYTIARLREAEEFELQQKSAYAADLARREWEELTAGATPEELEKIANSSALIRGAEELFSDNPLAHAACLHGFAIAHKVAAAMQEGMPVEEAVGAASAPPEGPPSPEELMAALQVLVEQGLLSEEEATQLLAELQAGGASDGAAPPDAGGAMPAEEVQKAAAVKASLALIESVID